MKYTNRNFSEKRTCQCDQPFFGTSCQKTPAGDLSQCPGCVCQFSYKIEKCSLTCNGKNNRHE